MAMKLKAITWQLLVLSLISFTGDRIVQMFHLPLPGSVVGMAILFALLSSGIVKVSQLQVVTGFLLKHMAFFFVPITVGLMNYWDFFYSNGIGLLGSMAVSLLIAFLVFRVTAPKEKRGE
ncbi:CidA/LrgA family protein [Sporomusa sp.]|uniref:CidA/LrgA family protein n=1 Tax=Sporomusa sp. TaxID=2078658 RepID=UPI002C5ABD51|nr:CidA/LrgA family protein [Sporomusa sp.]HWR42625.1 CidA/LrgA family protein [Sporomusa sp.]